MLGSSLYHFYDGLWYDPAERQTHDLQCERQTHYRLSQPDMVKIRQCICSSKWYRQICFRYGHMGTIWTGSQKPELPYINWCRKRIPFLLVCPIFIFTENFCHDFVESFVNINKFKYLIMCSNAERCNVYQMLQSISLCILSPKRTIINFVKLFLNFLLLNIVVYSQIISCRI